MTDYTKRELDLMFNHIKESLETIIKNQGKTEKEIKENTLFRQKMETALSVYRFLFGVLTTSNVGSIIYIILTLV